MADVRDAEEARGGRHRDVGVRFGVRGADGAARLVLDDADHLEDAAAEADALAEHLLGGEELAHAEFRQDADIRVLVHVGRGEHAAGEHRARNDFEPVRHGLDHAQFEGAFVEAGVAADHARGDRAVDAGHRFADARLVVVEQSVHGQARPLGGGVGEVVRGRLDGVHHDVLAAEALDGLERLVACALADGEHRDHGADAEHHAEHREERTRLVAPDVRRAELDEGPVEAEGLHVTSGRKEACRP